MEMFRPVVPVGKILSIKVMHDFMDISINDRTFTDRF